MQQTQTAFTPRNNAPLFARTQSNRVSDLPELTALLRHFAFDFAATFGADRAMAHISALMEGIPPLIDLRSPDGVDEDTHCWQIRGIQEILLISRGRHNAEMKLHYISRYLNDATWKLGGTETSC